MNQYGSECCHSFFSAYKTEVLSSSSLDGDNIWIYSHDLCKASLHSGNMRIDLGLFCANSAVAIAKLIAFLAEKCHRFLQQDLGVDTLKLIPLYGREMVADIALVGCSENGIAECMNQHISIRMAIKPQF